jgi:hypothetical protein
MEQNNIEQELLNNPSRLSIMNNLLKIYQFTENFLIKTRIYYDSWKCIRTQNNLTVTKNLIFLDTFNYIKIIHCRTIHYL